VTPLLIAERFGAMGLTSVDFRSMSMDRRPDMTADENVCLVSGYPGLSEPARTASTHAENVSPVAFAVSTICLSRRSVRTAHPRSTSAHAADVSSA
jgi:hypothetical protein